MELYRTEGIIIEQGFFIFWQLKSYYGWIDQLVEYTFLPLNLDFTERSHDQIYTLTGAESD